MSRLILLLAAAASTILTAPALAAPRSVQVYVYPSFVSGKGLTVSGRVLNKSRYVRTDRPAGSKLKMFLRSLRRFTRRAPGLTPLKVTWRGQVRHVISDSKGYFSATFTAAGTPSPSTAPTSRPASSAGWPRLQGPLSGGVSRVRAVTVFQNKRFNNASGQGFAVAPTSNEGFSVVSDIDDTLIASHISNKLKMLKTALLKDFRKVKVFPGALTFLRTALRSPNGRGGGTLHYVTGSPVNLYDRLRALFRLRNFPAGSMHMKYLSGKNKTSASDHQGHKLRNLRALLRAYPKRRFLLLGDSTEQDAPIYRRVRKEFPKQVVAILIHNVTNVHGKMPRFRGVTLFRDYAQALRLLREKKLLPAKR